MGVPWGHRQARRAGTAAAQAYARAKRAAAARQRANRAWASRRGPPSVVVSASDLVRLWWTARGNSGHGTHIGPPPGRASCPAGSACRTSCSRLAQRSVRPLHAPMQDIPGAVGRARAGSGSWRCPAGRARVGDLVGREAAPVGEHERLALRLGELLERLAHGLARRRRARRRRPGESSTGGGAPSTTSLRRSDGAAGGLALAPQVERARAGHQPQVGAELAAARRRTSRGRRQRRRNTSCTTSWACAGLPRMRSAAA